MPELSDDLLIGTSYLFQKIGTRWCNSCKLGLGNEWHHVHDEGTKLLYLFCNERHLVVIDTRNQHGVDLYGHARIHSPGNSLQLVENQYLCSFGPAVALT